MLAKDAMESGMIDKVTKSAYVAESNRNNAVTSGKPSEGKEMDLNLLKSQHPDVFAAAVNEGVTQERERVAAHLNMGEACGDMSIALSAIKEGKGLTQLLQSEYLAAGMRRGQMDSRVDDNPEGMNDTVDSSVDADEQVTALMERMAGVNHD